MRHRPAYDAPLVRDVFASVYTMVDRVMSRDTVAARDVAPQLAPPAASPHSADAARRRARLRRLGAPAEMAVETVRFVLRDRRGR